MCSIGLSMSKDFHLTFKQMWNANRLKHRAWREVGICHFSVHMIGHAKTILVVCPDKQEWAREAQKLGKWRHRTLTWHFPFEKWDVVMQLAHRIYGQQAIRVDKSGL